jgi:hypothetical protein
MDNRPKTPEEYVSLVDQALFEIEDLRMSMEYDIDSMGGAGDFLGLLEGEVKALRAAMANGSYRFGKEDLPFMKLVESQDDRLLPFKYLFATINRTHKQGLNVDEN